MVVDLERDAYRIDLTQGLSAPVFRTTERQAHWTKDQTVAAAVYLGGLIICHDFSGREIALLRQDDVLLSAFVKQTICIPPLRFSIFGDPKEELDSMLWRVRKQSDDEQVARMLDLIIYHVVEPFVQVHGGGDDGGGIEIPDRIWLQESLQMAA